MNIANTMSGNYANNDAVRTKGNNDSAAAVANGDADEGRMSVIDAGKSTSVHTDKSNISTSCNGVDSRGNATTSTSSSRNNADILVNGQNSEKEETHEHRQFLQDVVQMIFTDVIDKGTCRDTKVVEFLHPDDLEKKLDLALTSCPTSSSQLLDLCKQIIKYSVKTGHPHFFNQLYGGLDIHGLAGAWMTDALNTSQYTYEVAPVFTMMEKTVFQEMLALIGFTNGDAIFSPGGSISNMYAINLARYHMFPEVKCKGLSGLPKLCIMTSEKGHYSLKKGAALMGIGMDNVIPVKTDKRGRMIPEELEMAIERAKTQDCVPFIVNATAGTTVMGAYDPLLAIADICQKHGLWMHVDGAWGGSVLMSDKLRYKVKGIERADSVAWNPHKMMGSPLQTSAFFTRHKELLARCHSARALYLFQQDKFYDVQFDTGDKSLQCGRKVDVLKLWMMWKAKGQAEYAREIENMFHCASYLVDLLKRTEGFMLVLDQPECTNVCFWYIPPSLRGQTESEEWWAKVGKVAPVIKQRMTEKGSLLVGYQPDGQTVNFFRMVISNLAVTEQDMDFVVNEIACLGKDV